MERELFYSGGLNFSCKRCSACCRFDPGYVNLSEIDIKALATWAGLSHDAFIASYCRWVPRSDGYEYLCLLEKDNYDCILWENGCRAYEARPLQCSSYPFWSSLLSDEDWWNAQSNDCPGMNTGAYHSFEEIKTYLVRRKNEPYIRRQIRTTNI